MTDSRLTWLGGILALPLLGLVACSASPGAADDESAGLRTQANAFAEALDKGDAEAALAAVGVDRESLPCPELLSSDMYRSVNDRPTGVRVESAVVTSTSTDAAAGEAAKGLVSLTYQLAGNRTEQIFELTLDGSQWRAPVVDWLSPFGLITVDEPQAGTFEVAGQCGQAVADGESEFPVLPGRYTVSFVDASEVMTAPDVDILVAGGAESQASSDAMRATTLASDTLADFHLVPTDGTTAELIALLNDEATRCAADGLTGSHCGYGPPQNDANDPHLSDVHTAAGPADLPGPQIGGKNGAWRFIASPTLCIAYTVGGTSRCDAVTYGGTVDRDSSGSLVVTLDPPFVSPGLAP